MSHLKNFTLAHLPDEIQVYAVLYKDVENAAFLQQQLLAGNAAFEYAFIDASAVCERADYPQTNPSLTTKRSFLPRIYWLPSSGQQLIGSMAG